MTQETTYSERPIADWLAIFQTQTDRTRAAIADRLIKDLWGYRPADRHRPQDVLTLANALQAFLLLTNGGPVFDLAAAGARCVTALAANGAPNCEAAKEMRIALARADRPVA